MKILRALHAAYIFICFSLLFAVFLPLLLVPIIFKERHALTGRFNRWWAHLFFAVTFFPKKVVVHAEIDRKGQYIFCPNHFSYLDIPTMGLNPVNSIFVGKNDMERIPIFGFMYKKLHITVDRESLKSRYATVVKSGEAIDVGKSLMIFPEGGILSQKMPEMHRFKDGAFRIAIEKQIPVVPVTIPFNWIILPDDSLLPRLHQLKVVFHKPIRTEGLRLENLENLKQQTFNVINAELERHLNENR
ncbi:MAG: lysophospholipid acyltransferase family protein [Bacteroidota bacterium]